MGKTKTAFVTGTGGEVPSGEEKYKARLKKREEKEKKPEKPEKIHISGLKGGQRIKIIVAEPLPPTVTPEVEAVESKETKVKKPRIRGKKYQSAKSKIDRNRLYPLTDAIKLVKEATFSSFDGTIELHLVVKKTGLTTNVTLPHQFGKTKKIELASDKTVDKLKEGKIDFDVLLATADMMPKLVPFARILGPKGLMPNPKNGTLIKKASDADKFSANSMTIKTEKDFPVIHTSVGLVSQKDSDLAENVDAIFEAIGKKLIEKAYLKSTMSPSIKMQI